MCGKKILPQHSDHKSWLESQEFRYMVNTNQRREEQANDPQTEHFGQHRRRRVQHWQGADVTLEKARWSRGPPEPGGAHQPQPQVKCPEARHWHGGVGSVSAKTGTLASLQVPLLSNMQYSHCWGEGGPTTTTGSTRKCHGFLSYWKKRNNCANNQIN